MPPLIRYIVTQERQVRVTATNPADAAVLANRVFTGTRTPEDQINVDGSVRDISLDVRED